MATGPTLEREFHGEMISCYKEAREEGYTPSIFLQMVNEMGGVAAAKKLINDATPSDGFRRLWEMGRLDLTVEYVVTSETKYRDLFTPAERLSARKRYEEYKRKPT
jgi:hypothetical protein